MEFFKNLFGGGKSEVPVEEILWDRLFPEDLEVHTTFRHGLPHKPSCLAYDSVQQLLAIGSHQGEVVILGKPHLERHFSHGDSVAVLQIIFIENKGLLVSRCSNNFLYQWDLRDKHPRVIHTLEVKDESPCLLSWRFGSDWIYVGTEESSVYVVNLRKFQMSEYSIRQESVSDSSAPIGELVAISEQPHHKKKLLLAYMNGLCVLWNLEGRLIKRQFSLDATQSYNMLVSAAWHASGHRFAAAYSNGSIAIFNADDGKLERILTCRGSPGPAFQLQWFNVDVPDSWLLFGGIYSGPQGNGGSRHLTIHSSQETQLLSFPDPIVSFLCLPSCPYATAVQDPSCMAVLTQKELVVIDLLSPNLSPFSLAHAMDLNCSPVTSMQLCSDCPDGLVALLSAMHSKNTPADLSTKAWPLTGGRWGNEPLDSWADLLVTGHMDGSIRFWIFRSATMKLVFVINTRKYFKPVSRPNPVATVSPPPKPASLPILNGGVVKAPEVTIETNNEDDVPLSPVAVDETQKEEGSGGKLLPSLGAFKRSTTRIGKMVTRSKSGRATSGSEENVLSPPTATDAAGSSGDDEPFSLTKKLRGSMRLGRNTTATTEYIAYENAATYTPLSSRQTVVDSANAEEDGEYFAIHKLKMDVHSQTLVAANCAGHVLVLDFLSLPFKKHSYKQSLEVDFGNDTVLCTDDEETKGWPSPSFAAEKWSFWDDKPSVMPRGRRQSMPSGAQLVHHCYCFLKKKGVPLPVVITDVQFNRESNILAIGSEEGLAVIDISWNKCLTLMGNHLSLLYMADPKGHMDQVTHQQNQLQQDQDESAITQSEFMHRVSKVRKSSLAFQHHISLQELPEVVNAPTDEEGRLVTCLEMVQLVLQKGHSSKLTMWVGTASGHVMVYTINTVLASQVITDSRRELVPTGLIITLRSQVTDMYFLNNRGEQIFTSLSCAIDSNRNSPETSRKENTLTYALLCSRNYIKSLAFPGNKDIGFHEPELSGGCLVNSRLFVCQGLPCLLSLTSGGDILIHNLPTVNHLTTIPYTPLHDPRAFHTFQVAGDGQAVHLVSPSEIQRLSVTKDDHTNLPECLPDLFLQRQDPEDPLAKKKAFSASRLPSDRTLIFGDRPVHPASSPPEKRSNREHDTSSPDTPKKVAISSTRGHTSNPASSPPFEKRSMRVVDNSSPESSKKVTFSSTRGKGHGAPSGSNGRRGSKDEGESVYSKAKMQLDQRTQELSKLKEATQQVEVKSRDFSDLATRLKEKQLQRR